MNRPAGVPRRIEVGDRIRSPEFARGYIDKSHSDTVFVGHGPPGAEKYRIDDPERGVVEYRVVVAEQQTHEVAGFLIRGLTTMRWKVEATRNCVDGSIETIQFTQFCTSVCGGLDFWYVIPLVEFVDETERGATA